MQQSQIIEDSQKQIPLVNKSVHSIKSEQQFNSRNATKLVDKKNKSLIIPYNMTPFVKLHEPIKTKFILKDELNTSVQQFREPAENVKPEIDLFEQSIIKSPQNEVNEPLDPFKYIIPLEDPKIAQFPQLFIEPPVLIPYLLEFVSWDPNQLKEIAIKQEDYFVIFEEFKKLYKLQAQKMEKKFVQGRLVIEFLEEKYGILDEIQDIDFTLSQYLVSEGELFEQQEQKDEQLVKCQGELEQIRKDIYRIRIHCLELLTICDHQEDIVLHSNEFLENLREFGEQFRNQKDLFSEQILVYTLSDDLGLERVMNFLVDGSNDQSEEVAFFNNMVEYNSSLEQYTMNLRDLVKQFRIIIQQQLHKTNQLLQKHNQAFIKVEKSIQQIQRLFQEIPIIMTKLGLSLESGRTLLSRIKIPHLNYSQENQTIYDDYLKLYNENIVLINRVNQIFASTQITSQICQGQKEIIKVELSQYQAENDQIQELYMFLQQIPTKENIISNVQLQRNDIWKNTCLVQSEELLDSNKKEIQKLILKCQDIITNITQFFGQNKIPFQFVKLKQWAIAELMALEIELEIPKRNTNLLTLEPRINEFLKWESSVPHDNGELGLITQQIQTLYDVNYNTQTVLPQLQIEIDIDSEFNQLVGNEYEKLLNLNETYNIWKNMQAAGIVLSIDYIVDIIKTNKIKEYENKIDKIRKFFHLANQNQYTAYIADIDAILQSIISKDKNQALQLIQKSKAIPKIFKSQLEAVI